MNILILTQDEVETLLTMEACISVMAEAMAALARGHVYQPMRMMVRPPSAAGIMALMPSYMAGTAGQAFYGLKAMGVFHGNPAKGKDAHQGAVLLYSGETGELLSLMNGSAITAIRTAAVSALATRLLARPESLVPAYRPVLTSRLYIASVPSSGLALRAELWSTHESSRMSSAPIFHSPSSRS